MFQLFALNVHESALEWQFNLLAYCDGSKLTRLDGVNYIYDSEI
jgi:hypothetical protein